MSAMPAAPAFDPFRPRVRVEMTPHLALICYEPTVEDGLRAERIIEASAALRLTYDEARATALAQEMHAQVWALVVGVELKAEGGEQIPTPEDWREQLWAKGSLAEQHGATAWAWLFRRQLAAGARRSQEGSGGSGARPEAARGSKQRKRDAVPVPAASVPRSGRSVRAVR